MQYDGSKLRGKIVEVFKSQAKFSEALGVSEHSISMKLAGRIAWRSDEMARAAKLLHLTPGEIPDYFLPV